MSHMQTNVETKSQNLKTKHSKTQSTNQEKMEMKDEPQKQRQEVRVKYTAGQSETGKTNKYRK